MQRFLNSNPARLCGYTILFIVTILVWNNRHSYGLSPYHAGGMVGVWAFVILFPLLYALWLFGSTLVRTKKYTEATKECRKFIASYIEIFFPKKERKK